MYACCKMQPLGTTAHRNLNIFQNVVKKSIIIDFQNIILLDMFHTEKKKRGFHRPPLRPSKAAMSAWKVFELKEGGACCCWGGACC